MSKDCETQAISCECIAQKDLCARGAWGSPSRTTVLNLKPSYGSLSCRIAVFTAVQQVAIALAVTHRLRLSGRTPGPGVQMRQVVRLRAMSV